MLRLVAVAAIVLLAACAPKDETTPATTDAAMTADSTASDSTATDSTAAPADSTAKKM